MNKQKLKQCIVSAMEILEHNKKNEIDSDNREQTDGCQREGSLGYWVKNVKGLVVTKIVTGM